MKSLSFITVQSTPSQTLIQIFLAPPAPSNTTNLIRVEVCWREKDSILKSAPTVFKLNSEFSFHGLRFWKSFFYLLIQNTSLKASVYDFKIAILESFFYLLIQKTSLKASFYDFKIAILELLYQTTKSPLTQEGSN